MHERPQFIQYRRSLEAKRIHYYNMEAHTFQNERRKQKVKNTIYILQILVIAQ